MRNVLHTVLRQTDTRLTQGILTGSLRMHTAQKQILQLQLTALKTF